MTLENNSFKVIIASFLLFSALSFGRFAFAQEAAITPTDPTPIEGGAVIQDGDLAQETTTADAFNPVWLLPLIIIPIFLYLFWPRQRNNPMDLTTSTGYAGIKGGRASRNDKIKKFFETNIP